jgi:hypothetical protein
MSTWLNGLISFIIIIIVTHGIILYHMIESYVGIFYFTAASSSITTGHHISVQIRIALIVQWTPASYKVTNIR